MLASIFDLELKNMNPGLVPNLLFILILVFPANLVLSDRAKLPQGVSQAEPGSENNCGLSRVPSPSPVVPKVESFLTPEGLKI